MKVYLVDNDNPVARSLAEKLSKAAASPGDILALTDEEMKIYRKNGVRELPVAPNPDVQLFEIDPEKKYLMVVKRGAIRPQDLKDLLQSAHFQGRVLFTN